jgi:glycosyltransferase involved in cell wall biosynthesis
MRQKLEQQAEQGGLSGRIVFTGARRDTERVYGALDVFVLSSQKEGMPLVLLEAMASGRPVVATAVGGVPELITPGEQGLLVPSKKPLELANAIETVLNQPARARAMGQAGRRLAVQHFSLERMARETDRLFQKVLRQQPQRADSALNTGKSHGAGRPLPKSLATSH